MHRLYVIVALLLNLFLIVLFAPQTYAVSSDLMIYQVQAGGVPTGGEDKTAASREFISIYNNSDNEVNISNWCLSNKSNISFACFNPTELNEELHLPSRKFATVSSDNFTVFNNYIPDVNFITTNKTSGSVVSGADTISLIDPNGTVVDSVSWTNTLSGGYVLQRQFSAPLSGVLIDTDSNLDFQKNNNLEIPISGVEEWVIPDVCLNIVGTQMTIPNGYISDGKGNCNPEVVDVCLNIDGVQADLPDGYKYGTDGICMLDLLPIKISEMLPNAIGSDDGNEFIEFYNPNNTNVDLSNYIFYIGDNNANYYSFPSGLIIHAGEYLSFSNKDIGFTLVNSSSFVKLLSKDGFLIDQSEIYSNPDDGMAWALIDNVWQYTDQFTPNSVNLKSLAEGVSKDVIASSLQPCAANQYRNPETNRCRLLVSMTSTITPCRDGQYRSEETNRCRNIVNDVSSLLPCAEGQERNPATNRCRATPAVLGASSVAACKVGQERNPETNRCRNIVKMPIASYTPEQTFENSKNDYILWSVIAVSLAAIIYGIWEWRFEIVNMFKKISLSLHFKK